MLTDVHLFQQIHQAVYCWIREVEEGRKEGLQQHSSPLVRFSGRTSETFIFTIEKKTHTSVQKSLGWVNVKWMFLMLKAHNEHAA